MLRPDDKLVIYFAPLVLAIGFAAIPYCVLAQHAVGEILAEERRPGAQDKLQADERDGGRHDYERSLDAAAPIGLSTLPPALLS